MQTPIVPWGRIAIQFAHPYLNVDFAICKNCDKMPIALGDGAMVARLTLDQLIKVRILVSQY
jgi:hypothetical protein